MNKYKINYTSLFGTKASTIISAKSEVAALKKFRSLTENRYKVAGIITL